MICECVTQELQITYMIKSYKTYYPIIIDKV